MPQKRKARLDRSIYFGMEILAELGAGEYHANMHENTHELACKFRGRLIDVSITISGHAHLLGTPRIPCLSTSMHITLLFASAQLFSHGTTQLPRYVAPTIHST